VEEVKIMLRKSDFDRFVERLGMNPDELLAALKAEVEKAGPGFRYVVSLENFFYFVIAKLYSQRPPERRREVTMEMFEEALNKATDRLAGVSGYAKLTEVRDYVMQELGIGEDEFVKRLGELLQTKRGAYVLLEGGDVKVQIGPKKYGFIKRIERRPIAEVIHY
jgi:hypothetical protein